MRVLEWLPLYLPEVGGIENAVANIMRRLTAKGYEFSVLASHGPTRLPDVTEYEGIPVYRYHYREAIETGELARVAAVCRQIADLKRTLRPDIVHVHFSDPSVYFHLSTLKSYLSPTLVTLHNSLRYMGLGGDNTLVSRMLESADWVTGVSAHTLEDAIEQVPAIGARSSVVYNGLPEPGFQARQSRRDDKQLLCVGRLVDQKGFDVAVEAMAILVERFPGIRLLIAGDGPERRQLQARASELGLERSVHFKGAVAHDEVLQLLSESAIALMPSRYEGFPLVALEAGQLGTPVVASRVDGLAEVIDDGKTGLLIDADNPVALAQAVTGLLGDSSARLHMGQAARSRIRQKYTFDQCISAYDELYQRLFREHTERAAACQM